MLKLRYYSVKVMPGSCCFPMPGRLLLCFMSVDTNTGITTDRQTMLWLLILYTQYDIRDNTPCCFDQTRAAWVGDHEGMQKLQRPELRLVCAAAARAVVCLLNS